jgi:hypothetical protein
MVSRINFRQQKNWRRWIFDTKQIRELFEKRQDPTERVFKGLKYSAVLIMKLYAGAIEPEYQNI